ncbi:hypothetical protein CEXT_244731 [Caerostris extrusa]|uniref:Uncharacterized protein n=1 Tax=Caerostris extrusa TaxID=172846 RepID=A0AAV4QNK4_CAEEX|nr:hypothetical protein CEXT_244731 [Caerostris extrusa]
MGSRLTGLTNCENVAGTAVIDPLYREWDRDRQCINQNKTRRNSPPARGMDGMEGDEENFEGKALVSRNTFRIPSTTLVTRFQRPPEKERDMFLSHQNPQCLHGTSAPPFPNTNPLPLPLQVTGSRRGCENKGKRLTRFN